MLYKLLFYPNGKWEGGARIPVNLKSIEDFSLWSRNFIAHFKHLGKLYRKYITNDGEILGQEKANLVIELDGLIGSLVILRLYFTGKEEHQFSSRDSKYDYYFFMRRTGLNWQGTGWFNNRYTFHITNFADWYNNVLLRKIARFFNLYARAMEDAVLTPGERTSLIIFIETIIFNILVIEKVLVTRAGAR